MTDQPKKYRKKPVVVEAMQFLGMEHPSIDTVAAWISEGGCGDMMLFPGLLIIPTLEGNMAAKPGDWIIKGTRGEFYPCELGVFEEVYEEAESDD